MRSTSGRVVALAGISLLLFGAWFVSNAYPFGGQGEAVVVHVSSGETVSQLAQQLAADKVIGSTLAFRLDTSIFGSPVLEPGYFQINQNSSFDQVRSVFNGTPNAEVVSLSPGLTLREVEAQISEAAGTDFARAFDAAEKSATTHSPWMTAGDVATASANTAHPLEGLMGSGQYVIGPHESAASLVQRMQDRFTRQAAASGITPTTNLHGLSAYQLVIAASIVEKEGYYPVNMPKVARVIVNRLDRGMLLRMDSTVLYALGQDGGTVTSAMLRTQTPYNTYLHEGLTPTPICVVSHFALDAIRHPPAGQWLYFTLISKDGTMAFSNTFAQQLANERLAASRGIL